MGGYFSSVGGGVEASCIAAWDGWEWRPVGHGISFPGAYEFVHSLAAAGDVLVAGGEFSYAGWEPATNIAIWDGQEWNALGSGTNDAVRAAAFAEQDLYVGGLFTRAGIVASRHIGHWSGHAAAVPEPQHQSGSGAAGLICAPNPYSPGQAIWLTAPATDAAQATIFDVSGRAVTSLSPRWTGPERARLLWEGQSATGIHVSPGVYYLLAQVGGVSERCRIVLLR